MHFHLLCHVHTVASCCRSLQTASRPAPTVKAQAWWLPTTFHCHLFHTCSVTFMLLRRCLQTASRPALSVKAQAWWQQTTWPSAAAACCTSMLRHVHASLCRCLQRASKPPRTAQSTGMVAPNDLPLSSASHLLCHLTCAASCCRCPQTASKPAPTAKAQAWWHQTTWPSAAAGCFIYLASAGQMPQQWGMGACGCAGAVWRSS